MADEVSVSGPTGPNGERLEVNLKNRSIGLSTRDLLPILVVIGAFVGGLLIAKILFLGQTRGQDQLDAIVQQLHAMQNHEDEGRRVQTDLTYAQTEAIRVLLEKLSTYIEAWFTEVGTRLEWHDHNTAHPDRRMPLRTPSQHEERPAERGQR